jgi:hypothetical protein
MPFCKMADLGWIAIWQAIILIVEKNLCSEVKQLGLPIDLRNIENHTSYNQRSYNQAS